MRTSEVAFLVGVGAFLLGFMVGATWFFGEGVAAGQRHERCVSLGGRMVGRECVTQTVEVGR